MTHIRGKTRGGIDVKEQRKTMPRDCYMRTNPTQKKKRIFRNTSSSCLPLPRSHNLLFLSFSFPIPGGLLNHKMLSNPPPPGSPILMNSFPLYFQSNKKEEREIFPALHSILASFLPPFALNCFGPIYPLKQNERNHNA